MSGPELAPIPDWLAPLVRGVVELAPRPVPPALRPPADGSGRESAVLIALSQSADGPGVLLIERASGMRTHAGQVAFPGGAVEAADADADATALREAAEEVGLRPASVQPLARMPRRFLPPSGFIVTPVLAWWHSPHAVGAVATGEVARALVVPMRALSEPAHRFRVAHPSGHLGAAFEIGDLYIWGFTAGLLDELLRLGGWERRWNLADVRRLPARMMPAAGSRVAGSTRMAPSPAGPTSCAGPSAPIGTVLL